MDILYTVDEKYLQAVEELNYGELPKALHYFTEIIDAEPGYARAYYQLGSFYYYQFKNYQLAGYYYKECIALEPAFPDVYEHYLNLLITLKMHNLVHHIAEKALTIPGVCRATIFEILGMYAEEQQNFKIAKEQYRRALLAASGKSEHESLQGHLKRIHDKENASKSIVYAYQG